VKLLKLARRLSLAALFGVGGTIVAGGLVHATGASLACPDWPLCFGRYFPSLYPLSSGVFFEHGHRLLAGGSGLLILALAVAVGLCERTTLAQRVLAALAFVLVVVQALFGAAAVLLRLPRWISVTHFLLAQITLLCVLVVSWSLHRPRDGGEVTTLSRGDRWLAVLAVGVTLGQMVLGAGLRHIGTRGQMVSGFWSASREGMVPCPSFPLCPPAWLEGMLDFYHLVYLSHRVGAVLVVLVVGLLAFRLARRRRLHPACYTLACVAVLLVFVQVLVGELSVRSYLAPVPVTLHLAGAVLLLVALTILSLRALAPDALAVREARGRDASDRA